MSSGGGGTQTQNVNTSTAQAQVTINQTVGPDVTNALQALAGSQTEQAQLYSYALLQSQAMDAGALQSVADSVRSLGGGNTMTGAADWLIAITAVVGLLVTMKVINLHKLGLVRA